MVLDAKVVEAVRVDVDALTGVRQVVLVLGTAEVIIKCLNYSNCRIEIYKSTLMN